MPSGPVELLVLKYTGDRFTGVPAAKIKGLVDAGFIRIIDVIFARKHPASVDEVMGLSPFPRWPGMSHAIPWLERFVLSRNDRGGRAWGVAAALTQGAHYWEGVEAEARDQRELAWLIGARRRV